MMRGYRIPGRVWALAVLIVIVLLVILAAISTSSDHPILFLGTVYTRTLTQGYDGAATVAVTLVAHSGDVFVGGGAPGALSGEISTTYEGDYPALVYTVEDGHGVLRLAQPPLRDLILLGGLRLNSWDVHVGELVPLALAIEMGVSMGWHKYTGNQGAVIAIDRFGASAPGGVIAREFGFSVENVVAQAKSLLSVER